MKKWSGLFVLTVTSIISIGASSGTTARSLESKATNSCIKELWAAPSTWGPQKTIHSCFGDDPVCKFTEGETSGDVTIRYQIQKNSSEEWEEYLEGTPIHAQVIKVRASSNGVTGVLVKILVESSCGCD